MRANDWLLHMNKTLTCQQLDNGILSIDYIRRIRASQKGIFTRMKRGSWLMRK